MAQASPGTPGQPDIPPQGSAPPPPPPPFPNIPGYPGPGPFPPPIPPPGFPGFPGQPPTPSRKFRVNPWLVVGIIVVVASLVFASIYVLDRLYGPPDLTGTWSVSLSGDSLSESGTMSLVEVNNEVTGTTTLSSSDFPGASTVSGAVIGNAVSLEIIQNDGTLLNLAGTFSDSTHMSGSFTLESTDGSPPTTGPWSATKTS